MDPKTPVEAELFNEDGSPTVNLIKDAAKALSDGFKDLAPEEALTRALTSEVRKDVQKALFWVEVYRSLTIRGLNGRNSEAQFP